MKYLNLQHIFIIIIMAGMAVFNVAGIPRTSLPYIVRYVTQDCQIIDTVYQWVTVTSWPLFGFSSLNDLFCYHFLIISIIVEFHTQTHIFTNDVKFFGTK